MVNATIEGLEIFASGYVDILTGYREEKYPVDIYLQDPKATIHLTKKQAIQLAARLDDLKNFLRTWKVI